VSTNLKRLLIIQDRDRKILKLTRESQDIPTRKEHIEDRLSETKGAVKSAKEEINKRNLSIKEIEGEVEACQGKIAKFREQQFQVKSNNDYRALEKEIKAEEKAIQEFEEKDLQVMEEVETLNHSIKGLEQELREEDKLVQQDMLMLDKRAENIELEIKQLQTDREDYVKETDPEWLSRYERIMENKKDFALVGLVNRACGGCYMTVPPQTVQNTRSGLQMTFCDYCGRMLYFQP